jgi:quinoprotein glucose dehydrogenase
MYQTSPPIPTIDGLPIVKPPYGRITAIDMKTGEHLWQVANGSGPRDHPLLAGLDLPPLGVASRPAALVTRSLLFLADGSDLFGGTARDPSGTHFRAYDKATGGVVWEVDLGTGATGGPMSYMYRGKQYIVIATGSREAAPEWIALTLP